MYALSFDMTIAELQKHYGKNYNRAYFEIKNILKDNGFTILLSLYVWKVVLCQLSS